MPRKAKPKPHPGTPNKLPTSAEVNALVAFAELREEAPDEIPTYPRVSARLGKTRSAAQALLDQCEAKGLLERPLVTVPGPRVLTKEGERWVKMTRQKAS